MDALDNWFKDWFGSPYYPILYKERNHNEALSFISVLVDNLPLSAGDTVLDLACGRGRHARFLEEMGFRAYGLDLSAESIAEARSFESDTLRFCVHDMREPFPELLRELDAIFNLFTSFGYFRDKSENLIVLNNIKEALKPGGVLVLDYLNTEFVARHLVPEEHRVIDNVQFVIRRSISDGRIHKEIDIQDRSTEIRFSEHVQALSLEDFQNMLEQSGFELQQTWGDYEGNPFNLGQSQRLILIAEKRS